MSFRITAILARREAAHPATSQENLRNLADDVRSCSDGIRSCSDGIRSCAGEVMEAAGAFDSRLGSTLPAVSRFGAIQEHELPALLSAVDAVVEAFQTRRRETARTSADLASSLDAVARDLGAVAGELQFHDITRQQIEHVVAALRQVMSDGAGKKITASGTALVRLQKAQLENAAAAFTGSTRGIDRDLASIAAIAETVTELESLEQGTEVMAGELRRTGEGLRAAVEEVQSIEGSWDTSRSTR